MKPEIKDIREMNNILYEYKLINVEKSEYLDTLILTEYVGNDPEVALVFVKEIEGSECINRTLE